MFIEFYERKDVEIVFALMYFCITVFGSVYARFTLHRQKLANAIRGVCDLLTGSAVLGCLLLLVNTAWIRALNDFLLGTALLSVVLFVLLLLYSSHTQQLVTPFGFWSNGFIMTLAALLPFLQLMIHLVKPETTHKAYDDADSIWVWAAKSKVLIHAAYFVLLVATLCVFYRSIQTNRWKMAELLTFNPRVPKGEPYISRLSTTISLERMVNLFTVFDWSGF